MDRSDLPAWRRARAPGADSASARVGSASRADEQDDCTALVASASVLSLSGLSFAPSRGLSSPVRIQASQ
eukprot:7898526-Pyramimonas_sp.AAC.1